MLIYSFITDCQAFSLRYKDNTTRDKNETKVGKQSANLGKNNEPIQNRLSFLIDCKSVILHHLTILSFPMVRPAWDNWWLLVDIVLTTALAVLLTYILNFLLMGGHGNFWHILRSSLPVVPWNWIIVLQIEIFFYSLQRSEMEKQMAVIEKEKALYQFEVLKNQINPHFLFNSLNVLASLAYQDTEKTNRFAKKLSTVYRYLLTTHGRATVTVQEELSFVESYLYLEHIRFGDALHVEIEDDLRNHHCLVIPASIQMLVENALKHNISTKKSPLIVHISIGNERITVRNNLQLRNYVASNGAGLKNLQRQYALYGTLVEILKDEKEFVVKLPFVGEDVNRLSTI
mgnify:CR=1 FL=1